MNGAAATASDAPRGRVLHLSSAHSLLDNRIVEKECRSLAEAGFAVTCVGLPRGPSAGPLTLPDGLELIELPRPAGRLARAVAGGRRCLAIALARRPDIVHFHDPELVPWMLVLAAGGRRVVFDVHEDYATAVERSAWIPRPLKPAVAAAWRGIEAVCRRAFTIVIAERYYAARFPGATPVLNYPRTDQFAALLDGARPPPPAHPRLLYTGDVTLARGAELCARLVAAMPEAEVRLVGRTDPALAQRLATIAGGDGRLTIEGIGAWLPFARIVDAYREPWTAGLAVMPDSPHYRDKELTKFFEYMAAGLPVIASDFPVWRELFSSTGAGLCVDPADPDALVAAVRALHADPARARAMGEAGRRAVRERFNWEGEARRLVDLYERLIGDAR